MPPRGPQQLRNGLSLFMQRESTLQYLKSKFSAFATSSGPTLDAYDLDRFLTRGSYLFYDSYLDSPPSTEAVADLVKRGVPRWPLINRGIVNEAFAFLSTRRARGLATPRQARYLRSMGHPHPWSVLAVDVSEQLRRLRKGERLEPKKKCPGGRRNHSGTQRSINYYD